MRCYKMPEKYKQTLALFYCQNVPESDEANRRLLEKEYGKHIRLFPLPCSGRMEPFHLLRALEEFADAAYLITCPEGACRYFEGNKRAQKRVKRTQEIISDIGLEKERVGILIESADNPRTLAELAGEILKKISGIDPSPVLKQVNG
jgi:coenzyme F420-reducing hydrogenase delta subunit